MEGNRQDFSKGGNGEIIDKEDNKVNSSKEGNGMNILKVGGNGVNSIMEEYGVT